jgi:coproporphyrinogen III oxidase
MKKNVVEFLAAMQNRFKNFCSTLDPRSTCEKKSWDSPLGNIDVIMSQGEVFEKASAIYCDLEIDTPPVLARKLGSNVPRMRALVLEMNIFPVNPHIPKGYMELRANIVDSTILAGGTDLFPYFPDNDAREMFASRMRWACRQHNQDYEALKKIRADFFKSKYTGEKVGTHAGVYFFFLEEKHFPFFRDMAETFFSVYGEIVEQRKDTPVSPRDLEHRLKLHGQWAQWILLEDEGTKFGLDKGIPAEALLGAILPPTAKF